MKNLGIAKLVYTRRVCFRLFFIKPTIFPPKLCKSKFACYAFLWKKNHLRQWHEDVSSSFDMSHTVLMGKIVIIFILLNLLFFRNKKVMRHSVSLSIPRRFRRLKYWLSFAFVDYSKFAFGQRLVQPILRPFYVDLWLPLLLRPPSLM